MVRRAALVFALVVSACSNDNGPNTGATGSSGAGGNTTEDAATTDRSTMDDALSDTSSDPLSRLPDGWSIKTIQVLVDEVQGGPSSDGGASNDGGPSSDAALLPGPWVTKRYRRETSAPQWPFQYSFDTGIDGWELAPFDSSGIPKGRSIAHSSEDFLGAATSGSLGLSWTFDMISPDEDPRGVLARAFSEVSAPRDWTGYHVAVRAKLSLSSDACAASIGLYALSGWDRRAELSNRIWLSKSEWRLIELDLNGISPTLFDVTQITEFGVSINRDLCPPL